MRPAKKICLYIIGFFVLLTIYIAIGSIDSPTFDDRGLLSQIEPIPDEENGYIDIAYLNKEEFTLFKNSKDFETLRRHTIGEEWDSTFVSRTLKEQSSLIESVKKAVQKPFFQSPQRISFAHYPKYNRYVDAARLITLSAINEAKKGSFNNASADFAIAIKFGELIKRDKNHELIAYLMGGNIQQLTVQSLLNTSTLTTSKDDIQKLINSLDPINSYKEDGYERIFSGELNFMKLYLTEDKSRTLPQRLTEYFKFIESFDIYTFVYTLFPKFYLHMNSFLNDTSIQFKKHTADSSKYCSLLNLPLKPAVYDDIKYQWYDLFIPNSQGNIKNQPDLYNYYFQRRCLAHSYFDAAKTVLAMRAYKADIGKYPDDINVLVPKYLSEIPIDSFDGKPLRYSTKNKWVYSIGADLIDDGGSAKTLMSNNCKSEPACMNNPTLPLE